MYDLIDECGEDLEKYGYSLKKLDKYGITIGSLSIEDDEESEKPDHQSTGFGKNHVDFGHHGAERLVSQQFMNAKPFGIGGFHRIHSVDERLRRFFYASFRCKKRKRFPRIT